MLCHESSIFMSNFVWIRRYKWIKLMENVNTLTLKDRSTRRHASWSCEDKTHTPMNKMLFHCVLSRFYFANVKLHWSENKMPSQAFSVITMDLGFEKHSHQRERYGISKVTKKQCGSSLNLNNCNCLFKTVVSQETNDSHYTWSKKEAVKNIRKLKRYFSCSQ